jgi:mRNA interferase RelE/StbE
MYEIIFRTPAQKFLKKLDPFIRKEILKKIKKLEENPFIGEPLVGNLSGLWKLRYDKYRIIYEVEDEKLIIFVLNIGHRKNVYG